MDVSVRVPGVVEREFGFERREIVVSLDGASASVRDVLNEVARTYPGSTRYFHPDGDRHDDIQVLVNGSLTEDYSMAIEDGDDIQVALPIAGG